jgi:hypothetical protein
MKRKIGRPMGTTKANGYKIAQDCDTYWVNRKSTYKKVDLITPTAGFMARVGRGLGVFLSPPNQKT